MKIYNATKGQLVILLTNGVPLTFPPESISEPMAPSKEIVSHLVKSYTSDDIVLLLDSTIELSILNEVPTAKFYLADEGTEHTSEAVAKMIRIRKGIDSISEVVPTGDALEGVAESAINLQDEQAATAIVGEPEYSKSGKVVSESVEQPKADIVETKVVEAPAEIVELKTEETTTEGVSEDDEPEFPVLEESKDTTEESKILADEVESGKAVNESVQAPRKAGRPPKNTAANAEK